MKIILTIFLVFISLSVNATPNFSKAKKLMYSKVFDNSGTTLYCGCTWSKKKVDLSSCGLDGYFPKKHRKRANRTEVEHIIPSSWLLKVNNKVRQCVIDSKQHKSSARKYCQKHDKGFKKAHNDLVNLFPTVGQINAERSNKPFVDTLKSLKNSYGKCSAESGSKSFVPPSNKKGDIARVAFYMSKTYGVVYSKRQQLLFEKWAKFDPISEEERDHNNKIIEVQKFGLKQ
ncbi:endonuclease [Colwellia sp. MB3u-55]|uniref:endonuclease n=1 Tax=Colwellia sp. MB3u-55 TaxID=2759810 RepID=UPI0015F6768B|nr:endonuclease [Colwellia sp. MB3u-55]MBA6252861.1 endonuclease [Colwellia sp. MB3u-55]